uniref:Large ribosomal subunit protein mL62 n=1 Tax=Caenorhabditis tropicalis TaxID=1561998 RepID=A0A1I7TMU0_9PELO
MLRNISSFVSKATRQVQATAASSSTSFNGVIPTEKIEKRFSFSSGPGGQNIQKNATKCEIRFKVSDADWLSEKLRSSVEEKLSHRINSAGELIIDSDRTRERHLNVADCFDKLRSAIYAIERDEGKRQTTEEDEKILRERAAVATQHRLNEKRRTSEKKASRRAAVEL